MGRLFNGFVQRTGIWGLFGLLFLLVGLVALPFGIVSQVQNQHFRDHAKLTKGVVVSQQDLGGRTGGTSIRFYYTVKGREYSAHQTAPNFAKLAGTRQAVLYDPANPANARLADAQLTNENEGFGLSVAFLLLAPLLMLVGFIWTFIRRHGKSHA